MSTCPFKVGETYPDGGDYLVEIIHILPGEDKSEYPVIGVRRESWEHSVEKPSVEEYTLEGRYSIERETYYDLIPPTPPMKRVPLGPEDVPPGSVISSAPFKHWHAVLAVSDTLIQWGSTVSNSVSMGYRNIPESIHIKRPGEDWQPMWKEVPATEGGPQ